MGVLTGCTPPRAPEMPDTAPPMATAATAKCPPGPPLVVHFYDVGQALSALVELPDGRKLLIDTGEDPQRAGCGEPCRRWHNHLLEALGKDLAGRPLEALWITHPHSDHLGGAVEVMDAFPAKLLVDNGRDLQKNQVKEARDFAAQKGLRVVSVDPAHPTPPLGSSASTKVTPVLPSGWLSVCKSNANECSVGLRVEHCKSSVLFTGDAEAGEEAVLQAGGPATVLQVGHHGSDTSTTKPFLDKVRPKVAVISAGKPGEGTNRTYCHPRKDTVERLSKALGGAKNKTIRSFHGASCRDEGDTAWEDVPASDKLWITARDGDVVLQSTGDGVFVRR